ncbi:MAG: glycosyltransferase [Bacteroidota bacterium]
MPEEPIEFSIIVPTYNRLPSLKRALESLFRQDFPSFEIIIVNDGSSESTAEYLTALAGEHKLTYLHQQNKGPALARNLGIGAARGKYIAFIDDDCIAPPNWLSWYHKRFNETGASGIGGSSRTGDPSTLFAVANDLIVNFFKENLNNRAENQTPFLTSNNAAYTKSCLDHVGGFHKDFKRGAEERDLNFRLAAAGEKLLYEPAIVIEHYNDADFTAFLKHQYEQGRGSYLLYANARKVTGKKPMMIPAGTYLKLFFYPFGKFPFGRSFKLFLLLILTQVVITIGYASRALSGTEAS